MTLRSYSPDAKSLELPDFGMRKRLSFLLQTPANVLPSQLVQFRESSRVKPDKQEQLPPTPTRPGNWRHLGPVFQETGPREMASAVACVRLKAGTAPVAVGRAAKAKAQRFRPWSTGAQLQHVGR